MLTCVTPARSGDQIRPHAPPTENLPLVVVVVRSRYLPVAGDIPAAGLQLVGEELDGGGEEIVGVVFRDGIGVEPYAIDMGSHSCIGDAGAGIIGAEVVEDGGDAGAGAGDAEGRRVGGVGDVEVDGGWVVGTWGGFVRGDLGMGVGVRGNWILWILRGDGYGGVGGWFMSFFLDWGARDGVGE